MKNRIVPALFCIALMCGASTPTINAFDNNAANAAAAIGILAGATYTTGATYRAIKTSLAHRKYDHYRALLHHEDVRDHNHFPKHLEKKFVEQVLVDHAAKFDATLFTADFSAVLYRMFILDKEYKDYPYALFKKEIDKYIYKLSIAQIFYLGSHSSKNLRALLTDLRKMRDIIVKNDSYIKEQRHFDEKHPRIEEA